MRQFPTGVPPENITFEGDSQACTLLLPLARQMVRRAWLAGQQVCQMRPTADSYIRAEITNGLARIIIHADEGSDLRIMVQVGFDWRGIYDIHPQAYSEKSLTSIDLTGASPPHQGRGSWNNDAGVALRWGTSRNHLTVEAGIVVDTVAGNPRTASTKVAIVTTTEVTIVGYPTGTLATYSWAMPDSKTLVGMFWDGTNFWVKSFRFKPTINYAAPLATILLDPDVYGRSWWDTTLPYTYRKDPNGIPAEFFTGFNSLGNAIAWHRNPPDENVTSVGVMRFIATEVMEYDDENEEVGPTLAYTDYVWDYLEELPGGNVADSVEAYLIHLPRNDGPSFSFMVSHREPDLDKTTAYCLGVELVGTGYVVSWSDPLFISHHDVNQKLGVMVEYSNRYGVWVFNLYEGDSVSPRTAKSVRLITKTTHGEESMLQKTANLPNLFSTSQKNIAVIGINIGGVTITGGYGHVPNEKNTYAGVGLSVSRQYVEYNNATAFRYVFFYDWKTGFFRVDTELVNIGGRLGFAFFPTKDRADA